MRTTAGLRAVSMLGALFPIFAGSGLAQEGRFEIGGFFGQMSVASDLGSVSNVFFTTTGAAESVDFGKYYGFRGAFFFTPHVGIEGNLSWAKTAYSFTVEDIELETVSLGEQFDASQLNYGGSLVFQFPLESGLAPYALAGFGWARTEPDHAISDVDTVSGYDFSLGGGLKYFFAGQNMAWLGLVFDVRFHFISEGLAFPGASPDSPRSTEFSFGGIVRPF